MVFPKENSGVFVVSFSEFSFPNVNAGAFFSEGFKLAIPSELGSENCNFLVSGSSSSALFLLGSSCNLVLLDGVDLSNRKAGLAEVFKMEVGAEFEGPVNENGVAFCSFEGKEICGALGKFLSSLSFEPSKEKVGALVEVGIVNVVLVGVLTAEESSDFFEKSGNATVFEFPDFENKLPKFSPCKVGFEDPNISDFVSDFSECIDSPDFASNFVSMLEILFAGLSSRFSMYSLSIMMSSGSLGVERVSDVLSSTRGMLILPK